MIEFAISSNHLNSRPPLLDRYVQEKDEYGGFKGVVKFVFFLSDVLSYLTVESLNRPFVIDLESTNGTLVNDEQIPAARYYELKAGDGTLFTSTLREIFY